MSETYRNTYKMFEPIAIHLSERTTDKNDSLRNGMQI